MSNEAGTELQSLEAALATLRPATPRLDRDRVMFAAGQASVTPRLRGAWLRACCHVAPLAAAAAAAVLATVWLWHPEPRIVERIVYLPAPQPPAVVADAQRPAPPAGAPKIAESLPAPMAANDFSHPSDLPRWLTALIGVRPNAKSGPTTRRMVGGQHFEFLAASTESPRRADRPLPEADSSRPASPRPYAVQPTMSRQSLDHLLDDMTAAPRGVPPSS